MLLMNNCILLNENIMHIIVDRELMVDKNEYHMNDQSFYECMESYIESCLKNWYIFERNDPRFIKITYILVPISTKVNIINNTEVSIC